MSRRDSAAIVSKTSELLPEPETPVNTVSRRFGISTLMSLRLFSRAPCTRMRSWLSAAVVIADVLRCGWSSADRPLHELGDPRLRRRRQLDHRERDRPHVAVVEAGVRLELERRVANLELRGRLEEADDLAVLGPCRHAVVGLRHEARRGRGHERMDPLAHD